MQAHTSPPMVIAHRGASALRPEHTLEAYRKALEDGADAIEPDLVSTRDGVLVARHENEIGGTTDVATHAAFADRKAVREVDGVAVEGWFVEDFTLEELKRLRARERLPGVRSTAHDGRHAIPTLAEMMDLVAEHARRSGRAIALVPELKHPSHFQQRGLAMEDRLLDALRDHAYFRDAPVLIQSFETSNLRSLRERLAPEDRNIRLLQLFGREGDSPHDTVAAGAPITYGAMATAEGLAAVARYADSIGVHSGSAIITGDSEGRSGSRLVEAAHAAGLSVFVYTFRPENLFLAPDLRDGPPEARNEDGSIAEIRRYLEAGIDGFFADDPALGRQAVDAR